MTSLFGVILFSWLSIGLILQLNAIGGSEKKLEFQCLEIIFLCCMERVVE